MQISINVFPVPHWQQQDYSIESSQNSSTIWDRKRSRTLPPPIPNFDLSCALLRDADPKVLYTEVNNLPDTEKNINPGTPSILKGLPFPAQVVHEDSPSIDLINESNDLFDEDWRKEILSDTPAETDMFFQPRIPLNAAPQNILGASSPLLESTVEEQCNKQDGTATKPWELKDASTPGSESTAQNPQHRPDGTLTRPWEL
ncbi:hypothetical protein DID88_009375 [Monilinia fructigena]|uniref:Uncharacterized protein n=1 Tax=Monilinia fructigena TaxID=38457 RepID=A0A395IMX2_9HELO|nr:hypothetical protein DID88_009375 [Monilinia fructigena]